ncbi:MAG TPA: GNAT family N-acetyltransferase [Terriglobia bacterium]|nr:GNAT family N-acetyltransferase [Terriglobia bacterium]
MKEFDLSQSERQGLVTLRNGLEVLIRPGCPDDEDLATECLRRVSRADLRLRYFGAVRASDPEFVKRLIHVDSTAVVFVAIDRSSGAMIGAVRLHVDESRQRGEYAVLVRSDLKGQGLGWELMQLIIDWAKRLGLGSLEGQVLRENTTMIEMCRELGFEIGPAVGDNSIVVARLGIPRERDY